MKRFALAVCLSAGLLVWLWPGGVVRAQPPEIQFMINYQYHSPQKKPLIHNGRIRVAAKEMAGIMGWRIANRIANGGFG